MRIFVEVQISCTRPNDDGPPKSHPFLSETKLIILLFISWLIHFKLFLSTQPPLIVQYNLINGYKYFFNDQVVDKCSSSSWVRVGEVDRGSEGEWKKKKIQELQQSEREKDVPPFADVCGSQWGPQRGVWLPMK